MAFLDKSGLQYAWNKIKAVIDAHIGDSNNPHNVTAAQIGLGNVDNTSDSEKYVAYASNSGQANKTKNKLVIRLNGGTTEGVDMFTFDGSTSKSINITASKLGL